MRKLLGVAVAVAACGAGGVTYTAKTTKGVACGDEVPAWCDRLIECGIAPTSDRSACVQGATNGCCGDSRTCGDPVFNPVGAANCVNKLPTADCASLGTNGAPMLPAYCQQMF